MERIKSTDNFIFTTKLMLYMTIINRIHTFKKPPALKVLIKGNTLVLHQDLNPVRAQPDSEFSREDLLDLSF